MLLKFGQLLVLLDVKKLDFIFVDLPLVASHG
jgi:hypothetical protein